MAMESIFSGTVLIFKKKGKKCSCKDPFWKCYSFILPFKSRQRRGEENLGFRNNYESFFPETALRGQYSACCIKG